jgi:hypothetical protein
MRSRILSGGAVAVSLLLLGCNDQSPVPTNPEATAATSSASPAPATSVQTGRLFTAPVRGAAEVPPRESDAVGNAGFQLSLDGTRLRYVLLIGRLDNVTQAHIHLAPPGQNGPVVAWLYPSAPPAQPIPGEFNGVLGEGVITAANLVGPLQGQPFSALVDAIRAGNTYVNVHTQQWPGGELRSQITHLHVID